MEIYIKGKRRGTEERKGEGKMNTRGDGRREETERDDGI